MNGIAKLMPSKDKIKVGSLVKYNDKIYIVTTFTKERNIITIQHKEDEKIDIDLMDCKLHKYYIFANNGRMFGELAYIYYKDIADGDKVDGYITTKKSQARVGDRVHISAVPINVADSFLPKTATKGIVEGIIEEIKDNKFVIKTTLDSYLILKRNSFNLMGKPNNINIFNIGKQETNNKQWTLEKE